MERGKETLSPAAALSALQWWTDAGVDVIVDEAPRDWLRPAAPPSLVPQTDMAVTPPVPDISAWPGEIEAFRAWIGESDAIPLASAGAGRVGPSGDPASGLMILVDMPGEEDVRAGELLAGDVGTLFDRMLAAMGRDRQSIYLASLSVVRTPSGRLDERELAQAATLARHHAGLAAPRALLLFGDACAQALIGLSVAEARGRWHEVETPKGPVRAIATLNPARLLDHPRLKAAVWADLQMLMEGLKP